MRKTKKVLSVLLSAAMVATALPGAAFAANTDVTDRPAEGGGSINGGGTIIEGLVYKVSVPDSLEFVVNPLKFSYTPSGGTASDSQIISPGYGFINKSSVPIELDVDFQFATADGVTIAESAADIKNTTGEAPTLYMEVQPTAAEPTANSGLNGVEFTSSTFVTSAAVAIAKDSATTMRFKMNKANYTVTSGTSATYQNNDNAGDVIGFKFDGRASMFSDWEGKTVSVTATYDFGGISDTDYADSDNVTSGKGFNVLNKSLMGSANTLYLTSGGDFGVWDNFPEDYSIAGLYCVFGTAPLGVTKADIIEAATPRIAGSMDGLTINGKPVVSMAPSGYTWNTSTQRGTYTPAALASVSGQQFVWFTVLTNAEGDQSIVTSEIVTMD